jgi:hypothetical protein
MNTESNRAEFRLKLTDKFERSVVAFLNYAGGGMPTKSALFFAVRPSMADCKVNFTSSQNIH